VTPSLIEIAASLASITSAGIFPGIISSIAGLVIGGMGFGLYNCAEFGGLRGKSSSALFDFGSPFVDFGFDSFTVFWLTGMET
jgi:hypothetical protein